MDSAFSFGSYSPGHSVVHRLDPRVKLVGGLAFIVLILCARSPLALVPVAVFVAALYALAHVPGRAAWKSLAPLLAIVVLASVLNLFTVDEGPVVAQLGPVRITQGGAETCAFIACRLFLMMTGMSMVTLTTPTLDLTEATESLLRPLSRFGFPAHEIGMILGIALRFMPQLASELRDVYRAQASRGAGLSTSPVKGVRMVSSVMVPLFASVFRHAETLAEAMDARCYHGGEGRTRLHRLAFAPRDAAAVCAVAVLAGAIVATNVLG